ncbi:MAG: redoxin domain-containing protein, partial [Spirochaetia bacterium]|nr:redoxin domain-containing protein [Spirochaetia bacterium]
HFLLKTQCPYCLRFTSEYKLKGAAIGGLVQIFIKPDAEEDISKWSSKVSNGAPVIYQDNDAKLADRFGIPGGYKFHSQEVHYPATILLDQNGREFFRYVGKNNSDRLSFDAFEVEVRNKIGK